jgi:hypothetical protein
MVGRAQISSFHPSFNRIKLFYSEAANTVAVAVNATPAQLQKSAKSLNYRPNIKSASFFFFGQAATQMTSAIGPDANNFAVTGGVPLRMGRT